MNITQIIQEDFCRYLAAIRAGRDTELDKYLMIDAIARYGQDMRGNGQKEMQDKVDYWQNESIRHNKERLGAIREITEWKQKYSSLNNGLLDSNWHDAERCMPFFGNRLEVYVRNAYGQIEQRYATFTDRSDDIASYDLEEAIKDISEPKVIRWRYALDE